MIFDSKIPACLLVTTPSGASLAASGFAAAVILALGAPKPKVPKTNPPSEHGE